MTMGYFPFKELVPELFCETLSFLESVAANEKAEPKSDGVKDDDKNQTAADDSTKAESKGGGDKIQYKLSCFRDNDDDYEGDDLLLKCLTLYFKQEVMTWVNQPPCSNESCKGNEDGKQMEGKGTRGPVDIRNPNKFGYYGVSTNI